MTAPLTGNDEAMALPVPPGLPLYSHQQEGIRFALNRLRTNRGLLWCRRCICLTEHDLPLVPAESGL
jgi:hypothetical protein